MRRGNSQHSRPGIPGHTPPRPQSIWGPAQGDANGKLLLGQAAFGSITAPQQLGAGGWRCASTQLGTRWHRGGRRLQSHVGCVGAVWGGRASPELGAWQDLPAKLPLTSEGGRTTLIYSYSFFTYSCVTASLPVGPSEENPAVLLGATSGSSPNSDAAGPAFFLSQ